MLRRLLEPWLSRSKHAAPENAPAGLLNPATCVSLNELIGLQRHARTLDLKHRHPARAQLAGGHHSRFRGRGMDYLESRSYQPGDDIRNMDWRVTARAGRAHTKLFQEERERPVVLFLDFGPSLFFATRGALKSVIAARAAALIGWAAAAQGDRIGALLFNGGHHELRPRSGHRGVLALIHSLLEHADPVAGLASTHHNGGLNEALVRLRRIVRPGSLVIMISDFYGLDNESGNHLSRLRQHNDLIALHISDPIELAPPPPGRYGITDGTRCGVLDTRSAAGCADYAHFIQQHHHVLQRTLLKRAIPQIPVSTTDDVVAVLAAHFGKSGAARAGKAVA